MNVEGVFITEETQQESRAWDSDLL
jgi:hypothetical protein